MAFLGPFPVEFGAVFPSGAFAAGGVEKVRDFDKSSGDRGGPADRQGQRPAAVGGRGDRRGPEARQRTVKVKVAAEYQPVLPSPAPGSPFTAVEFEGMTAMPYVDTGRCQGKGKCAARSGVLAQGHRGPRPVPGDARRPMPEHKDAA